VIDRLPDLAAGAEALPDYGPAQPAVIIYTSGTTGKPKGVLHTQGSLFQKGVTSAGLSSGAPGAVRVISLPMMHVSGQWLLSMNLYMGAPTALLPKFEPGAALDTIERFAATDLGGLPTMIQALIEEQAVRPRDVSSLRWVISGGDVVSPTLQERFAAVFGVELLEIYGMTEMCAICINPSGGARPGSAGPALGVSRCAPSTTKAGPCPSARSGRSPFAARPCSRAIGRNRRPPRRS
jgi:long-chain acyl-CoA synthetase